MQIPSNYQNFIQHLLTDDETNRFFRSLKNKANISVRRNSQKIIPDIFTGQSPVLWEPLGEYLHQAETFVFDPQWHAGLYYVQEASSMIIGYVVKLLLNPNKSIHALDACAAPGGKSTHLIDVLPKGSTLISNEIDRHRYAILNENCQKWGSPLHAVTHYPNSAFSFCLEQFDLILVDAPCSGEGMFRKELKACEQWSPQLVYQCQERQKQILSELLPSLKKGGLLIYSTCTFNSDENEKIGDWLIQQYGLIPLKINLPNNFGFTTRFGKFTTVNIAYPHLVKGEGFAFQVFKDPRESTPEPTPNTSRDKPAPIAWPSYLPFSSHPDFLFFRDNDKIFAKHLKGHNILKTLHTLSPNKIHGYIPVATIKGNDFIPNSNIVYIPELFKFLPKVNLNKSDALKYLKGLTNIEVDLSHIQNTWFCFSYKDIPLGWAKKTPKAFNNYYPKNFRIRISLD